MASIVVFNDEHTAQSMMRDPCRHAAAKETLDCSESACANHDEVSIGLFCDMEDGGGWIPGHPVGNRLHTGRPQNRSRLVKSVVQRRVKAEGFGLRLGEEGSDA